jgi:hypothetical protein
LEGLQSFNIHWDNVPLRPRVITQPESQVVIIGTEATLALTASGGGRLGYQWQLDGGDIPAATNTTLVISNAQPSNAGGYSVVVTNSYGTITSEVAVLAVKCRLTTLSGFGGSVAREPDSTLFDPGATVTLTALAEPGFEFFAWGADASGNGNPLTLTMDTNKTVNALFASTVLSVFLEGPGSVARVPDLPYYRLGDVVRLTGIPVPWHIFAGWGDGFTANPRDVIIGFTNAYAAIFSPTTAVETLTFSNVSRLAPVGMPAVLVDGEFIVTGSVARLNSAEVAMQTTFPGGTLLYTSDGSAPSFNSRLYLGPFAVRRTSTIRAIAYNADFTRAWEADPIQLLITPTYALEAGAGGGGTVTVSPPAGAYVSNSLVSLIALPASGWRFLQWLGDATGADATNTVLMTRDRCLQAVFGTTLSNTVTGAGSVIVDPLGSVYPYGAVVKLTAVPQPGNYFALWGNAASSTNNPLRFVVTNATPTVSALFASLSAGQFALTVVSDGFGQVTNSPRANRYNNGQSVTLTALPEADQSFLGWSGDAGGANNPLSVTMTASKVITAHFTRRPRLTLPSCAGRFAADGLKVLLTGEFGAGYVIEATTNLAAGATVWTPVATVTNVFGAAQVNDPFAPGRARRFYRAVLAP